MPSGITFSGLGSGIDSAAIINALLAVERVPIEQLEDRKSADQKKIDLIGTFRGLVDTLRTKANALGALDSLLAFKVTSSVDGLANFSASGAAQAGTHTLEVQSLATTDRWAFDGVTDPDADLATVDGQAVSFTYDGVNYSAPVNAADSSLNEIASAINSAAPDGVTASVVNAGTSGNPSWQLVLTAQETGEDFRIENLTSTVAGLVVDGTGPDANGVAQSTNNISVGLNAVAIIDGLTVERTSNDFSDVIAGVSISLLDAQPGTTAQFTVEPDKAAVKGKIKEFVNAYNEVTKFISKQNSYDEEKGAGGPLFGDNALATIQRTLRTALFGQSAAQVAADTSGYGSLRLLGVESTGDGTLKINDKVMDAKMDADLDAFADFFADRDGFDNNGAPIGTDRYYFDVTADTGFGDDLARALDSVIKSYGDQNGQFYKGVFEARVESLNANIKTYNSRIDQREVRIEKLQAQLVARFAALESTMARLQSQSAYLSAG